jgi:hypothetical protein
MTIPKPVGLCLLLSALPYLLPAQATSGQQAPDSVRRFVQSFYDWYVPFALSDNRGPAWDLALKYRTSAFGPELLRSLREDSEAQARVEGVIVGLDFDPFLNSQDPCERYEVGRATQRGESYRVDVHALCAQNRNEDPEIVAELVRKGDSWVFVNFHYPSDRSDLLTVLKLLREERQKS